MITRNIVWEKKNNGTNRWYSFQTIWNLKIKKKDVDSSSASQRALAIEY